MTPPAATTRRAAQPQPEHGRHEPGVADRHLHDPDLLPALQRSGVELLPSPKAVKLPRRWPTSRSSSAELSPCQRAGASPCGRDWRRRATRSRTPQGRARPAGPSAPGAAPGERRAEQGAHDHGRRDVTSAPAAAQGDVHRGARQLQRRRSRSAGGLVMSAARLPRNALAPPWGRAGTGAVRGLVPAWARAGPWPGAACSGAQRRRGWHECCHGCHLPRAGARLGELARRRGALQAHPAPRAGASLVACLACPALAAGDAADRTQPQELPPGWRG